MGAFLGVLFAGVDIGLAIGIGMSLVIALYHTAFPKTVRLGQLPDTYVYRCVGDTPLCTNISTLASSAGMEYPQASHHKSGESH